MGLYTESIRKKEENNIKDERYADEALIRNRSPRRSEEDIEDVQSALLYMLERFGLRVTRIPRQPSVESLLETMLDPLGMMYEEKSTVAEACQKRSEYVLAFRHDGKAVVLPESSASFCSHPDPHRPPLPSCRPRLPPSSASVRS